MLGRSTARYATRCAAEFLSCGNWGRLESEPSATQGDVKSVVLCSPCDRLRKTDSGAHKMPWVPKDYRHSPNEVNGQTLII
jgi:hypothetical protein